MDTDKQFYRLFEHWPELLFVLRDEPVPAGPIVFSSPVIKALERRVDAVITTGKGRKRCLTVMEIEAGHRRNAYTRTVTEMAMLQEKSHFIRVHGVILFVFRGQDAALEPWTKVVERVCMEDEVRRLASGNPTHPAVLTLMPLFESSKEVLEASAKKSYKIIHRAALRIDQREACLDVFISFLSQRLPDNIMNRLFKFVPFEETPYGRMARRHFEKLGKAEGKAEGLQSAALLTVRSRWPQLGSQTLAALRNLEPARAEVLLRDIWKMSDASDLTAWLKARKGSPARRSKKAVATAT